MVTVGSVRPLLQAARQSQSSKAGGAPPLLGPRILPGNSRLSNASPPVGFHEHALHTRLQPITFRTVSPKCRAAPRRIAFYHCLCVIPMTDRKLQQLIDRVHKMLPPRLAGERVAVAEPSQRNAPRARAPPTADAASACPPTRVGFVAPECLRLQSSLNRHRPKATDLGERFRGAA
jgi:hypothetical protein